MLKISFLFSLFLSSSALFSQDADRRDPLEEAAEEFREAIRIEVDLLEDLPKRGNKDEHWAARFGNDMRPLDHSIAAAEELRDEWKKFGAAENSTVSYCIRYANPYIDDLIRYLLIHKSYHVHFFRYLEPDLIKLMGIVAELDDQSPSTVTNAVKWKIASDHIGEVRHGRERLNHPFDRSEIFQIIAPQIQTETLALALSRMQSFILGIEDEDIQEESQTSFDELVKSAGGYEAHQVALKLANLAVWNRAPAKAVSTKAAAHLMRNLVGKAQSIKILGIYARLKDPLVEERRQEVLEALDD